MRTEYQAAIAQLTHEKGLPQDVVTEAVANALLAAYRKSVGGGENVRIEVERSGEVTRLGSQAGRHSGAQLQRGNLAG